MKATFENTVAILVKAYFDNTLEHDNCYACAVGNIIAHNMGYEFKEVKKSKTQKAKIWSFIERDRYYLKGDEIENNWYDTIDEEIHDEGIKSQLSSTGYNINQLRNIESAFEKASKNGDWIFNGLMAVVDVLAGIHGVDLSVRDSAKLQFVKA